MYNFEGMIFILCVASAIIGWASIEFILWLFSFVSISFGG